MADYASAIGFVQFPPNDREANGQNVREFTIKTPGTDGILIRITVWPELQTQAVLEAVKGDLVAADGKLTIGSYKAKDGEERTSVQISATALAITKGEARAEREVVNEGASESQEPLF